MKPLEKLEAWFWQDACPNRKNGLTETGKRLQLRDLGLGLLGFGLGLALGGEIPNLAPGMALGAVVWATWLAYTYSKAWKAAGKPCIAHNPTPPAPQAPQEAQAPQA